MTVPQKSIVCLLLSFMFTALIVMIPPAWPPAWPPTWPPTLTPISTALILLQPLAILLFSAIFLTLFLIFFFLFNFKQKVSAEHHERISESVLPVQKTMQENIADEFAVPQEMQEFEEPEELEEIEAADTPVFSDAAVTAEQGGGLLAAAALLSQPLEKAEPVHPVQPSSVRLAFDEDDIPYVVESSAIELVDEDIDETIRFMEEEPFVDIPLEVVSPFSSMFSSSDDDAAELEVIANFDTAGSFISRPFSLLLGNPELLPLASGIPGEVIFEHEGIPYIDNSAIRYDKKTDLNSGFAKLVESVVGGNT